MVSRDSRRGIGKAKKRALQANTIVAARFCCRKFAKEFAIMALSDKVIGGGMILIALLVFTYYTAWAILLPFLDKSNPLHDMFPSREWAVRVPAFLFVAGLTCVGGFIGMTVVKENRKKALKARQRDA